MFARQSALGGSSGNQPLIEFRAGRMNMVGKMVHPDTRKGLVYLNQAEDGLIHFCWKDRVTGKVEDDLIIFPDDFEFKRVEQCKTGRVFVLKFKTSTRRLFFWMQEPKTEKDEEYCRRVNEIMNSPPSANRSSNEGGDLQYMLNNMSQQQLMQLFGGVGQMGGLSSLLGSMNSSSRGGSSGSSSANRTSTTAAASSDTASPSSRTTSGSTNKSNSNSGSGGSSKKSGNTTRITLPDLQSYLSELSADTAGGGGGATRVGSVNVDLSSVISSSDAVNKIISDPERAKILSAFLPLVESNVSVKQQLKDTLSSPQFQQALSLFSNALQSGQLGPVVSQFKLPDEAVAAANTGDLEQFVKALEKTLSTSSPASTPTSATTTGGAPASTAAETTTTGATNKNDTAPAENTKSD